ncbi:MAG: MMPL family transporter [Verrucomicrobiales bacterium]|nr:MMPL family transporter [Verrucomicrobiales bacterium]
MSHSPDPVVARLLRRLARAVHDRPRWFFYPQAVLFLLSLLFTVQHLQFDTNRDNLVANDRQSRRDYLRFMEEFNAQSELVAVVESEDIEKNRQFVERLGARLETETNLFSDVFYKGDFKMMGPKALLFVTNSVILDEMATRLTEARPVLERFSQVTNLNSLFGLIIQEFRAAGQTADDTPPAMLQALPALARIADQAVDALTRPGVPPSPGVTALFDSGAEAESSLYITFSSNRIYLVTARPRNAQVSEMAVQRLRDLVATTRGEVPGVNVGVTGEPVLEVDEMAQSQRDMAVATALALVLCGLLFIYGYRETGRPLKAMACLVVGLVYTLGFATATIGHLNLLTITFLPILVGLAIDFGIHLVTRYEEELRHGRTEQEAVETALVHTGRGIFTGALTTAGAFFAMGLADFKGIREMGIISGGGLLISLVPMMTLLPVLLLRGRQNLIDHFPDPHRDNPRARLERLWMNRPLPVTLVVVVVSGAALFQFPRVRFDYNLLNLQSRGLPAVVYEHKLINADARSVLFGAVMVDSLDEAKALESKLLKLPSVSGVDSMARFLTEDQTWKMEGIRRVKSKLAGIDFAEPDEAPVDVGELRRTLRDLQAYLGLGASLSEAGGEADLSIELRQVRNSVQHLRLKLARTDHTLAANKLGQFQRALLTDLRDTFEGIKTQVDSEPLRVDDIPPPLRHRFVGKDHDQFLLMVFSNLDLWERDNQERFLEEVRTVAPNITGTPVQLLEYTTQLKDSYIEAAWYAAAAIALMVLLHFRSIPAVLLALLPVGLGMIWLGGWMGWQGLPFNPANIMTLPLVIGVGVTNGIHILSRCSEEGDPCILARSTGKAVMMSGFTTILGFGSLMVAKHQGIASLGELMAVGTTTCMLAGLTFLPTLVGWLNRRGWHLPGAHRNAETLPSPGTRQP